jgi:hypothetical protein
LGYMYQTLDATHKRTPQTEGLKLRATIVAGSLRAVGPRA